MWISVEHTTCFTYDSPITEAYTELRLRPLDGGGQQCAGFRLVTHPPGLRVRSARDRLGNEVLRFDVLEPHERLEVVAASEVSTPDRFVDPGRGLTLLEAYDYLQPTAYAPFTDRVRALGRRTDAPALVAAVREAVSYEPGATDVQTSGDEALELGRGVCQDFAHVLLAACRSNGIVSRYVSGYLYDPADEGAQVASHAWIDVWSAERGWESIDPTHDREQTDAYVRVAVGRDYADVSPTRGVFRGSATETLETSVRLEQIA
jgi:transglutaminase-like putative cysteine protease